VCRTPCGGSALARRRSRTPDAGFENAQLPVEAVLSSLERNAGDHGGGEAANVELAVYSDLTDADLLSTRIEALITFGVDCVVIDSVLLSHDRLASLIDTLDQRCALIGQKSLTCSTTPGPTSATLGNDTRIPRGQPGSNG